MRMNIPNILSFSRIILTPIFIYMFLHEDPTYQTISLFIFAIGGLSDYFDGLAARKLGQSSELGKFIDPLADKILVGSTFIVFSIIGIIPWWMTSIILIRDITTTVMRNYAISKSYDMKTSNTAKLKTFLQFMFLGCVMALILVRNVFFNTKDELMNSMIYSDVVYLIMLGITVFTIVTLFHYLKVNKSLFIKPNA